jgi:hypothetical protein
MGPTMGVHPGDVLVSVPQTSDVEADYNLPCLLKISFLLYNKMPFLSLKDTPTKRLP